MKIVIDSNIFIGLYESNEDTLSIFNDLEKIKTYLVVPQQIIDEVIRNRDERLFLLSTLINSQQFPTFSTSLIRDLNEFPKLKIIKGQFTRVKNKLKAQIDEMIADPEKDPIFKSFLKLIKDSNVIVIPVNDDLIKKAQQRKLKGNPPNNEKEVKIGDEIIWECILKNVQDDLILISRDSTYSSHKTFLTREFKQKTGKKLLFSKKISDALELVGKDASPELKQFEKEQQKIGFLSQELYQLTPSGSFIGASMADIAKMGPISLMGASMADIAKMGPISLVGASISDTAKAGQLPSKSKDKKKK